MTPSIPVRITSWGWSGYTAHVTMSRLPEIGDTIAAAVWRQDKHNWPYQTVGRVRDAEGWYLYVEHPDDVVRLDSYYRGFAND